MKFRSDLFLKEFWLFGATMALGLLAAYRYSILQSGSLVVQAPELSIGDIVSLAVVIAVFVFVIRFNRLSRIVFWLFLSLIVFSGAQVVLDIVTAYPWDVLGSLLVLIIFIAWRSVLAHDLAMIIGLAGIAAALGVSITPTVAIIALIILSFYDIIAVYKTRHMVKMAEGMIRTGAIFGFIIPSEGGSFLAKRNHAQTQIGEQFMILGSGDIGLPIIFAGSLMRQSLAEALIVGAFAVLGVMLTHILFVNQTKRAAMAALPPIATMCLVGYVLALLIIK